MFKFTITILFMALSSIIVQADSTKLVAMKEHKSAELFESLKKGGLILYMRHATTSHSKIDKSKIDLEDCKTQRNLSDVGRSEAKAISAVLKKHKIKFSQVISSPFCRCKETALLTFGKMDKTSQDLFFAIRVTNEEKKKQAVNLKKMLGKKPSPGTNTVLVSHTANLKEATGIWPKPEGVVHFFKPKGDESFEYLGKILPNEWKDF